MHISLISTHSHQLRVLLLDDHMLTYLDINKVVCDVRNTNNFKPRF